MQKFSPINQNAVVDEFIFDFKFRFGPSSITEADGQLFHTWNEHDRSPEIFLSLYEDGKWSPPETLFEAPSNDVQVYDPSIQHINDELHLFFSVGHTAEGRQQGVKGYVMISSDLGVSWTVPELLPFNSPSAGKGITKSDGHVLFACQDGQSMEFVSRSNLGVWDKCGCLAPSDYSLGMPVLVEHKNGVIQLLARSTYKRVLTGFLQKGGSGWSAVGLSDIPVPNSTIDAISLVDGRILVAYNHSESVRTPLCLAISEDGYKWRLGILIDDREDQLTFPCLHQDVIGRVHLVYTRRKARQVVHLVIEPDKIPC